MTNLLDKVPLFRGSQRAYAGFLDKLRADSFDNLVEMARLRGDDISIGSKTVKDIANVVNILTGGANIGPVEAGTPLLNSIFFSPRKLWSDIQMLNPKNYTTISPVARRAMWRNTLGSVGMTMAGLTLLKLAGAEVEESPISSDFGKAKIGKTRIDATGGKNTLATLVAKVYENKYKSTTTGRIKKMGIGYKPTTRGTLIGRFLRNKLSPNASFFADWATGKTSTGEKFELGEAVKSRLTPMIIQDFIEMYNEDVPADVMALAMALDIFGFGIQTY
jgi:hypothetical protein